MPTGMIVATVISLVALLVVGFSQIFKKKSQKMWAVIIVGLVFVYFLVGLLGSYGVISLGSSSGFFLATTGGVSTLNPTNVAPASSVVTTYQPTATYVAKDKFSTAVVTGTSYYQEDDQSATTTAKSNVNAGTSYTYWVSNTTGYFVKPLTLVAGSGVTGFVATAYKNSTPTLTLYDLTNRNTVSDGGASNVSLVANGQANIELTYLGTSKQSAMPFGGVFVVEYNSSISSVTCTGADLTDVNPFHLTYTSDDINHVFKVYAVAPSLDDGTVSSGKKITCQFLNGAVAQGAGTNSFAKFKFIPANYYVSQAGAILLDTEKYADSDTTRTNSFNNPSVKAFWI